MRYLFMVSLLGCATTPPPADLATGAIATWQTAAPLPTPRANHCSAVIDDWILVIGGNHKEGTSFVKTAEIHAAQVQADGSLGPWQLAGHTASPVSECNATSEGRKLYVIDGLYDTQTDGGQIWKGELDATGHFGALASIGRLPMGVIAISSKATVHDGTLLLMNTRVPNVEVPAMGDLTVTLRTRLDAIAWSTDDWKIGFRAQAQYAFTYDFAYTLGGYHDPAVGALAETFAAPIGSDGAIGTPINTAPLPQPVAFGEAVAVDDWMFVVGGRAGVFGVPGTTNVYAASIAPDGSLGAWQTSALPMARTNHDVAIVGDYLVLTGGAVNGPGDTTVLTARVRYPRS
jgi:hypothetical protein